MANKKLFVTHSIIQLIYLYLNIRKEKLKNSEVIPIADFLLNVFYMSLFQSDGLCCNPQKMDQEKFIDLCATDLL